MNRYTVGVDFGTLSARASVVSAENGETAAEAACPYRAYQNKLSCGIDIPAQAVLADPLEYIDALVNSVKESVRKSGISPDQIVGIAVDATSLSLVVTDASGTPMCMYEPWKNNPHAYIKLWKSHSAQTEAEIIQKRAEQEKQPFLDWCGGHVSCEWAYPKMLETYLHDPLLFESAAYFWDLCDWLTMVLCGQVTRNAGSLCFKFNHNGSALPGRAFCNRVSPGFGDTLHGKLEGSILRWGDRAGTLLPAMAEKMGLPAGIAVGGGSVDGHVSMTALGLNRDGDAMITLGTSGVCAVISKTCNPIRGVCGTGMHGLIPGMCGYDSGQASVGDTFAWFVDNLVPRRYFAAAGRSGISIHQYLSKLAFLQPPQPCDLVALDWWNGNRCTLGNLKLRGMINGFSLDNRTEDIYRTLIESTAFGLRRIVENYNKQDVPVKRIRACGGIAGSNPDMMQCYADILGIPIQVSALPNAAAAGAAITAAVAAGCYTTLSEAMSALGSAVFTQYTPRLEYTRAYLPLYQRYKKMEQTFGRSGKDAEQ